MAGLFDRSSSSNQRFELGARTTLGRGEGNTITLSDPHVSGIHAEIRRTEEGAYQLVNLSATNGTFVRGAKVNKVILSDGDEIRLGSTIMLFDGRNLTGETPVAQGTVEENAMPRTTLRSMPTKDVRMAPRQTANPLLTRADVEVSFKPQADVTDVNQLRSDYERLRAAYSLSRAIGGEDSLDAVLERIVDTATDMLNADRAAVLLIDPQTRQPTPRAAKQRDSDDSEFVMSETLLSEVIAKRAAFLSEDVELDSRLNMSHSIIVQGIRSVMCVPMLHEDELLGVIYLDSQMSTKVFDARDLEMFTGIASQAAFAIKTTLLKRHIHDLERKRDEAIRALVSGASHFINNPLCVIRSNLTLLDQWSTELVTFHAKALEVGGAALAQSADDHNIAFVDAELGPVAAESTRAAQRIAGIVEAMRLFEGNVGEEQVLTSQELLAEVVEKESQAVEAVAQLHCDWSQGGQILGVRERLIQLFSSLLKNAREAIEPGNPSKNRVVLRSVTTASHIVVTVEDTGRGLPAGEEDKVFIPFFTSRLDGSLGLGLPIAAEVAHQHGGSIRVENRDVCGVCATVSLPLTHKT